ncbi:hypothetical protein WMY93_011189 [Mugilogobius chulae]|uniref:Uncharacterized protein n=1 Tax=Mugilogobius chulae TaxID=88201 RepID=A0AAW0PE03_9GOBI
MKARRLRSAPANMTKLQFLNVFLTERLMLAAQEIYKSVEDTILEYQEEIAIRERENDHLRRRLRDAGIEIWPDRPSMGLLEDEDGEHPRRAWSPSMGHEERIPIQIKDKRDHRQNPGPPAQPHQHNHGSSCSASENLYPPQRPEYPQEAPTLPTYSKESKIESEMYPVETQFAKSSPTLTQTHSLLRLSTQIVPTTKTLTL